MCKYKMYLERKRVRGLEREREKERERKEERMKNGKCDNEKMGELKKGINVNIFLLNDYIHIQ